MKKIILISLMLAAISACSPVLNSELMKQGVRDVTLSQVLQSPEGYKGKLFILGGVIIETRFVETGSQIEALSVPVDAYGYLGDIGHSSERFLALYPREKGLLDPFVYYTGREITLAGEFIEVRKSKIDEMEYFYPVFAVREIYLWEEPMESYVSPYPYPYVYYNLYTYGPLFPYDP